MSEDKAKYGSKKIQNEETGKRIPRTPSGGMIMKDFFKKSLDETNGIINPEKLLNIMPLFDYTSRESPKKDITEPKNWMDDVITHNEMMQEHEVQIGNIMDEVNGDVPNEVKANALLREWLNYDVLTMKGMIELVLETRKYLNSLNE